MGSVPVATRRLWKAVAFAAALWVIQSSTASAADWLLADLNGDGRTDQVAIVGNPGSQTIQLTFSGGTITWLRIPLPLRRLIIGDLDRDGNVDLVAATEGREIIAWLNQGRGRFTERRLQGRPHRAPPGPFVSAARIADSDEWSISSDPDSAITRLPLVFAPLVSLAALLYSDPSAVDCTTAPSRPRGPPAV